MSSRYDDELMELTAAVFGPMLGVDIAPAPDAAASSSSSFASVRISGAWNGVVVVSGAKDLFRNAAATMYGCAAADVDDALADDAMREIANIIGGNLKALLPGENELSLPTSFGADQDLGGDDNCGAVTVMVGPHAFRATVRLDAPAAA
jgi:CheY-specific phosphatase CheX